MRTAEQLKGLIRNLSKDTGLMSQEILQMYMFERVIDRLSRSSYKDKFVLKGGFLIASMIGVTERTTMDMDTTAQGVPIDEATIESIWKEVLSIDVGDGVEFCLDRIEPIRDADDYNNFRIYFFAKQGKINNPMKIDVTTGDVITPGAIDYSFKTMFDDGDIEIRTYNLETIIAEKYETIIRRNIGTTRARDFYDLYVLFNLYEDQINYDILKLAVARTSSKRSSMEELEDWQDIIEELRNEPAIESLWNNYCKENTYVQNINYRAVIDALQTIGEAINK